MNLAKKFRPTTKGTMFDTSQERITWGHGIETAFSRRGKRNYKSHYFGEQP